MLLFTEAGVSYNEVPGEYSLVIHIAGCMNACPNCQSPWLQIEDGDVLKDSFEKLLCLYSAITCVCFLGESSDDGNRAEFVSMCEYAGALGIKTCLYSGRAGEPEPWMRCFDFVKRGPYIEARGPLTNPTTNQRFYKNERDFFSDATSIFWKHCQHNHRQCSARLK
jgi:anaerobic ribonucleoside-triphosphate reductase activating protein